MAEPERITETVRSRQLMALATVTCFVLGATAMWFMLKELKPVLRPLLVAVFFAYVLLPYHTRLKKFVGSPVSIGILGSVSAIALVALVFAVSLSVLELSDELPRMQEQGRQLAASIEDSIEEHAPWLKPHGTGTLGQRIGDYSSQYVAPLVNNASDALLESCIVALYLLFLLLGASHFPDRVRKAYPPERAEAILHVAGQVNAAIVGYLKAKVKSSLALAIPSGIVMAALGVKFSLLWTVLIFLCNFVPYIGSVVGYTIPVAFAFLQMGVGWTPITVAGLLVAIQIASATVIEPTILGRAVGLSPLVILAALAFWGLLWSLPGMILAVPLTVVTMIVMEHFESTRPIARLVAGE